MYGVPKRDGAIVQVRRFLIAFAIVANLVLADAVVKEVSAGFLKNSAPVVVVPSVFNLAYVENRGCAWGMLQGKVWPLAMFGLVAMGLLIWKRRSVFGTGTVAFVAEVLLYSGIIGNLIDRIFRGYVIDMFDFHWGVHHFPCFNLADSFICIAAGLLILMSFAKDRALDR